MKTMRAVGRRAELVLGVDEDEPALGGALLAEGEQLEAHRRQLVEGRRVDQAALGELLAA